MIRPLPESADVAPAAHNLHADQVQAPAGQLHPGHAALDLVQVGRSLGEAAVARLTGMGLPCRPAHVQAAGLGFWVPAGADDELRWPSQVAYSRGWAQPVTALNAATGRATRAYRDLVTPPTVLWAVLTALTSSPETPGPSLATVSALPPVPEPYQPPPQPLDSWPSTVSGPISSRWEGWQRPLHAQPSALRVPRQRSTPQAQVSS